MWISCGPDLETIEIDGHDFYALERAFAQAKQTKGCPFTVVMKTAKGKSVFYMENQAGWHDKASNDEEYAKAMDEMNDLLAGLEAE